MKLPSEFEARTLEWMGEETYHRALKLLYRQSLLSVSIVQSYEVEWEVTGELVLWASAGFIYRNDRLLHSIRCFTLVAINEASSMFVEQVLRHLYYRPVVMLDLCAALRQSTHAFSSSRR